MAKTCIVINDLGPLRMALMKRKISLKDFVNQAIEEKLGRDHIELESYVSGVS